MICFAETAATRREIKKPEVVGPEQRGMEERYSCSKCESD